MQVLITRAEPAASRTAAILRNEGYEPVLMPLTELVDTGSKLPIGTADGYIFTSANAPEILHARGWQNLDQAVPAFCVGKRTADAAKKIGFGNLVIANGGGAKLAEEIRNYDFQNTPKLFYLTTADRQFDMQSVLSKFGVEVENCEIYRMKTLEVTYKDAKKALQSITNGAVLVYSTQSAKILLNIMYQYSMVEFLQKTSIITISKQAAKPFDMVEHQNIYISDVPNEISMLHILDKLSN